MIRGRITKEDLAAARQQLRANRAERYTPEVRVAGDRLWTLMRNASTGQSLVAVRDAAQQLKAAHFAAGWSEAESMSEAVDLLQACLDGARGQARQSGAVPEYALALMNAVADGFGLDLHGELPPNGA